MTTYGILEMTWIKFEGSFATLLAKDKCSIAHFYSAGGQIPQERHNARNSIFPSSFDLFILICESGAGRLDITRKTNRIAVWHNLGTRAKDHLEEVVMEQP